MSKSYREEQEAILEGVYARAADNNGNSEYLQEGYADYSIDQALESLQLLHEREVRRIIGPENEYNREMPIPNPFALPQDYTNLMKRYQLKRAGLKGES